MLIRPDIIINKTKKKTNHCKIIARQKKNEKKLVMMIDFSVSHMSQIPSSLHQSVREKKKLNPHLKLIRRS
uniref:Uncharacterized protein n=1 Tax=Noccaea caerulescens TaxID=107243 RepID=A0A1J3HTT1_NOCCA